MTAVPPDVEVDDLGAAVAQENVRVLLDPAGHPFCLYLGDG